MLPEKFKKFKTMNAKVLLMLVLSSLMIGSSFGKPQNLFETSFGQDQFFGPDGGFGNANAAGLGNGAVINGQAIGTGTGLVDVGPGGFGIGLGIGAAVDTPLGQLAIGDGQSISAGK